jgi:hypothetical protein
MLSLNVTGGLLANGMAIAEVPTVHQSLIRILCAAGQATAPFLANEINGAFTLVRILMGHLK